MMTLLHSPYTEAYRDAVRPHGIFEDFACQRLGVARWYYERAAALAAQYEPDSPEGIRFLNMAHRWESSYNRTMREIRQLQTERALANPNCRPPFADVEKVHRVAKRNSAPTQSAPSAAPEETGVNAQPQSDQHSAKQNADPYPGTARNASCPCGSGEKYKRCCGHNAPPVLYAA